MPKEFYQDSRWERFSSMHPGGEAMTRELLWLTAQQGEGPLSGKALDLCCGRGETLMILKSLGYEAWGLDLSPVDGRPEILAGTADSLPWEGEIFQLGICECSLSVLWQQGILGEALLELYRVLKPGGVFGVSDLYGKNRGDGNILTLEEYEEQLRQAGFERIQQVDKTQALREFAARWLWEFEQPFPFCEIGCKAGFANTGYMLMTAQKRMG